MKILIISDLWVPFPGGAERYVANIAYQLADRGHDIQVLTSYEKAFDSRLPVTWRDIGVHERRPMGEEVLWEELEKAKPDLVLTHHFFAYEFPEVWANCSVPLVQVIHNTHRLPSAYVAIYNSEYTKSTSNPQPQDMVIHPPAFQDVVATKHGQKIGFVKPVHHKGADYVYRLAARLPHRQVLVLRGEWGGSEDIREMDNVEYMMPVRDIREFYEQCYLLLMPSWTEDAGTIPQEAALNGLPCLSTPVMGLPETNGGGLVIERDEDLWMAAIERLYQRPRYYDRVVRRQVAYLQSFRWQEKFDELHQKIQAIYD